MTNRYCQLHHRCACFSITGDVRIGEKLDRRMNTAGTSAKKLPEMYGMEGLCIQTMPRAIGTIQIMILI